jgi:hypothetical protein
MTNTQHTPGPWRIGDAGFTVFGPPKPGALPETIAPVKNRANARLIAAAPELLEVLEDVLPWLQKAEAEGVFANCAAPQGGLRAINRARAAIAKATGAQS